MPCLVKVCGLTDPADAQMVASAGAAWIGLNFHPPSPRSIDLERAWAILNVLPATSEPVGLFVNRPPGEVRTICRQLGLTIVQLHGDEPPSDLIELAEFRVVRAFRIGVSSGLGRLTDYLEQAERLGKIPDAVLLDAHVPGLPGGTGQLVEDSLLDGLPPIDHLILAGGLTPDNVAERVARVKPWMVDVASGVERSPGRKDPARVRRFVRAVASMST